MRQRQIKKIIRRYGTEWNGTGRRPRWASAKLYRQATMRRFLPPEQAEDLRIGRLNGSMGSAALWMRGWLLLRRRPRLDPAADPR